jgi:hypothetical protein
VLEREQLARRLLAHDLDGVLVAEVVGALDVSNACDSQESCGSSAALIPPWAALECEPDRMNLRDDPTDAPASAAAERRAGREARPNDQYVVLRHAARSLFRPGGGRRAGAAPGFNYGH